MMNGMSTLVEAAMIATESAPPGLDALNPAYQLLDTAALGRQKEGSGDRVPGFRVNCPAKVRHIELSDTAC